VQPEENLGKYNPNVNKPLANWVDWEYEEEVD
jgi:hypothetical protein